MSEGRPSRDPADVAATDLGSVAEKQRGETDFLGELFRNPLDPGYAAAAGRRGHRPPWRRRAARAVTMVTLVAVGVLLAVAYRQVAQDEPARAELRDELVEQVHEQGETTTALADRAEELREEVARLRDEQLPGREAQQLRNLELATGLARVTGEGAVVRVADGTEKLDPATGEPVPDSRILDYDLQRIANALWAAGAEAVAINDHRLISTSTIRSASGAILVNRLPVTGPYRVVAIGPDDLAERFAATPTSQYLQQLVREYGIEYDASAENDLTLPAAVAPELHNAVPEGADPTPTGGD